jgi:transcriptional regulator with XRE-family HTH domain
MDEWTKQQLNIFKPRYTAALKSFYEQYPARLQGMLNMTDPHNVNIKAKITQRTLAAITEVIPQNLNKILYGRNAGGINMTLEQAIKFSVIFGCTLDYLVKGIDRVETKTHDDSSVRHLEEALETEKTMRRLLEEQNKQLRKDVAEGRKTLEEQNKQLKKELAEAQKNLAECQKQKKKKAR